MAGPANLIKAQIMVNLNALVTSGVLGGVLEKDVNINAIDDMTVLPGFPCAIIGTSNMHAAYEYPQSNRRMYQYDVLIVQQKDSIVNLSDMEDLRDAIALQFDNNVTLNGAAPLGVEAVTSDQMTIQSQGNNYIVFFLTIKATTLVGLTYTF